MGKNQFESRLVFKSCDCKQMDLHELESSSGSNISLRVGKKGVIPVTSFTLNSLGIFP